MAHSMDTTTVRSAVLAGVEATEIKIEAEIVNRLPCVVIVGMPAGAVRETAERVRSAITASGFEWPRQRIVVNILPADLPKTGPTGLDLPIAVSILAESGQLSHAATYALSRTLVVGELSLSGSVRSVRGSVPMALLAEKVGRALVLGGLGTLPVSLVPSATLYAVSSLLEALAALEGKVPAIRPVPLSPMPETIDYADVRGQSEVVSTLEAAVCQPGTPGDYILLVGKPGCGKTMLARRLTTILPALTLDEAREVAAIHSAAGLLPDDTRPSLLSRPFRAPHSSVSTTGMIGDFTGRPGEVSLAQHGILLLDEAEDFRGAVLGALHAALREGTINARDRRTPLPARPALVVVAISDETRIERVTRYLGKPRTTIRIKPVSREAMFTAPQGEASAIIRARVEAAWKRKD